MLEKTGSEPAQSAASGKSDFLTVSDQHIMLAVSEACAEDARLACIRLQPVSAIIPKPVTTRRHAFTEDPKMTFLFNGATLLRACFASQLKAIVSGTAAVVLAAAISAAPFVPTASAGETETREGDFETTLQDLKDAVINRGYVIDYTGNIDTMLDRTGDATGNESPMKHAKYIHFCSAALTHGMVAADPANMAACPYVLFVYETKKDPGKVVVGYRKPPEGDGDASEKAIEKVEKLLEEIVKEVAEG